jgi:hypothetical protein
LQFTALLHHIYHLNTLRMAYFSLKREAAPGVDGETWRHYGEKMRRLITRWLPLPTVCHPYPLHRMGVLT